MISLNNKTICESCLSEVPHSSQSCPVCGFDKETCMPEIGVLEAGEILAGKYLVGRTLGRGGFGVTYLGYDINNDRKIAIKEYLPDGLAARQPGQSTLTIYTGEKESLFKNGAQRFFDEAKMVSRFNGNRNIIGVFEFFKENNTAYYVMEYIEGIDFKKYIAKNGGKIPVDKAVEIITPVMDALAAVHSAGILHRDISPDNLYISNNGNTKLLDFGAARQVLGGQSKSLSIVLKQGFAPLEQYQSRGNFGPWSDIYALGATFYYAITGIVPESAMDRIDKDLLKYPSQLGANISRELENVIMRSLSLRIENRQQSMNEFKSEFLKALTPQLYNTEPLIAASSQSQLKHSEISSPALSKPSENYVNSKNKANNSLKLENSNYSNKPLIQKNENIFFKRVIAYLIDFIFYLMLISLVYGIVTEVVLQLGMVDIVAENLFIILAVLSTVIFILINSNLESSKKGATLGKMIMGLKVVDLKGRQLTSKQSIIRNLYKLLTFILLLTDKNGQFLHENKSNSMVILK